MSWGIRGEPWGIRGEWEASEGHPCPWESTTEKDRSPCQRGFDVVRGPYIVVRERGVEPPRPFGHTDLNRARLPFRHSRPTPSGASRKRLAQRTRRARTGALAAVMTGSRSGGIALAAWHGHDGPNVAEIATREASAAGPEPATAHNHDANRHTDVDQSCSSAAAEAPGSRSRHGWASTGSAGVWVWC